MDESSTRKEIIDKRLAEAGWDVNDLTQVVQEFDIEISPSHVAAEPSEFYGHQFSDYVLLDRMRKPLAVIEAKKTARDAELGREQAKQYCYNIQKQHRGDLPFCFYTNGHDIFFWDLENYPPRKVFGFPTADDLGRFSFVRKSRKPLSEELINTRIAGRDYQIGAIRSVMEALEKRQRKMLLVMATGTGKTRTCIALVEAVMRAGWAERVLFLVDRIALKDQALDAFKEHLPNEPRWPKQGESTIATDRRIYVSTYPTMLNIVRDEKEKLSSHFFDLIIIDESHRSIYNTYGEILDYFNTITLGLTATPTDVIDHNTFKLFHCDDGLPTFAYSYEEAVNNIPPYLCNFQVMKIKTVFQDEGISKRTVSLEDQKKLIHEGKEIEEINFEGTDIEKKVMNKGTNALIVREFMEESIKDTNGVLPGKTIFFCMTKDHARRIEKLFDAMYPEHRGEIAKVLVSNDSRVYGKGGLLDQFKKNDFPRVAISVDMLDTGIDVREIVNLVFAKPVYSYTKFWQMIGRGTRLLDEIQKKHWCAEKDVFLILDCWDNFEYFKLNPKGKELKPQIPLPVRLFSLRLDKLFLAIELDRNDIVESETEALRGLIDSLPQNSVTIIDAKSDLQRLEEAHFWLKLSEDRQSFLRHTIQPLLRTVTEVDYKAMRFERDVVELSLALLTADEERFDALKESLVEEISELPLTVNVVKREESLIRKTFTPHYWKHVSESDFNELIENLGPLMKYIESFTRHLEPIKLDFQDRLKSKEFVEFGPQHESVSISKYREMVEERIKALVSSNPLLQKLQNGNLLSNDEAIELAEALHAEHPHITEELLRKVYDHRKAKLIEFVQHILGIRTLEAYAETVSNAFEEFTKGHSYLSSRQLEFLNLLKSFIIERGEVVRKNLIEAPFTRIHPDGIRGVFTKEEMKEIFTLIEEIAA